MSHSRLRRKQDMAEHLVSLSDQDVGVFRRPTQSGDSRTRPTKSRFLSCAILKVSGAQGSDLPEPTKMTS